MQPGQRLEVDLKGKENTGSSNRENSEDQVYTGEAGNTRIPDADNNMDIYNRSLS